MAKLELNALMHALHGTIGELVLVREGDNIYVRHRARSTPAPTEAQVNHTSRFGLASRWARQQLSDPALKAAYARVCRGHLTAHNVAVRDFMHAPVIESIRLEQYSGQAGDLIRIAASDDFKIVRLTVQIRPVEGEVAEEGEAHWNDVRGDWEYAGQTQIPAGTTVLIEAAAMDLPGNRATAKAYYYRPINH